MAKRQLRELQRLMAWSWDSRVDEHPPGEKAMHDFENVLTFQLDSRRRRTTPARQNVADAAAANSPEPPNAAASGSGAKQARKVPAEQRIKRLSPSPAPGEMTVVCKGAKVARLEPSTVVAAAVPQQQQQQRKGSPSIPAATQRVATQAAAAAVDCIMAGSEQEQEEAVLADASSAAMVEAIPAVRQQPALQLSPALPPSASAVTPAVLLAGLGHTPAMDTEPPSVPISTCHTTTAAALADANFLPTPAPTPVLLASAPCQPSGLALATQDRPPASPPLAPAAGSASIRQPAPCCVLTGEERKAAPLPTAAVQGCKASGQPSIVFELFYRSAKAPSPVAAPPVSEDSPGAADSAEVPLAHAVPAPPVTQAAAAETAVVQQPDLQHEAAVDGVEPMDTDGSPAPADPPAQPVMHASAAGHVPSEPALPPQQVALPGACANAPDVATPVLPASAPEAAPSVPAALEVPVPVLQAFAAADQLVYHQPRPSCCPPLFKQSPSQHNSAAQAARRPAASSKSPVNKKRKSPGSGSAGKENNRQNGGSQGLSPRTAEPAAPHPAGLSSWKQQQLKQLSASFHNRQRRLLELLSACNRVQQQAGGSDQAPEPVGAVVATKQGMVTVQQLPSPHWAHGPLLWPWGARWGG